MAYRSFHDRTNRNSSANTHFEEWWFKTFYELQYGKRGHNENAPSLVEGAFFGSNSNIGVM